MIGYFLFKIPVLMLSYLALFLPQATVLPFGIDELLVQGFGYIFFIFTVIPTLEIFWKALVFVLIWKLSIKFIGMLPIIRHVLHNR